MARRSRGVRRIDRGDRVVGSGHRAQGEAIGLGIMTELPCDLNIQRGGPSTGLPTKTEQSDLAQALYGRNGESPMPILARSRRATRSTARSRR